MRPVFGSARPDARPTDGPSSGTAVCTFSRVVGSQIALVSVSTRGDYARDLSYLFPSEGKPVAGIGNLAVITPTEPAHGEITVELGQNSIAIDVVSTPGRVDDNLLVHVAKDAVSDRPTVAQRGHG